MLTATPTIQYRTIEQRRAAFYAALNIHPESQKLRDGLIKLMTPRQIRQSARDGIFISYSRYDELFALDLSVDLRGHGLNVWLDMLDVCGDWKAEIDQALELCGLMLVITSTPALCDRDLQMERKRFMDKGKILLPVIYRTDTRSFIANLPGIDFRYSYSLGLQSLMRLLGAAEMVSA